MRTVCAAFPNVFRKPKVNEQWTEQSPGCSQLYYLMLLTLSCESEGSTTGLYVTESNMLRVTFSDERSPYWQQHNFPKRFHLSPFCCSRLPSDLTQRWFNLFSAHESFYVCCFKRSMPSTIGHLQEKCSGAQEVMHFMFLAAAISFGINRRIKDGAGNILIERRSVGNATWTD